MKFGRFFTKQKIDIGKDLVLCLRETKCLKNEIFQLRMWIGAAKSELTSRIVELEKEVFDLKNKPKRSRTLPSKTPKQHAFMEAIAHSPEFAKKAGVPQKVGKEFAKADDKAGITKIHKGKSAKKKPHEKMYGE